MGPVSYSTENVAEVNLSSFLYIPPISFILASYRVFQAFDHAISLWVLFPFLPKNKTRSLSLQLSVVLSPGPWFLWVSAHCCNFHSLLSLIRVTLFKTMIASSFLVYTLILLNCVLEPLFRINSTEGKIYRTCLLKMPLLCSTRLISWLCIKFQVKHHIPQSRICFYLSRILWPWYLSFFLLVLIGG